MNCFQTPKNTNKRSSKICTSTTDPANDTEEDTSKWTRNVKRKLVFEENEENAFIKLNNVGNSTQNSCNGRNGTYNKT